LINVKKCEIAENRRVSVESNCQSVSRVGTYPTYYKFTVSYSIVVWSLTLQYRGQIPYIIDVHIRCMYVPYRRVSNYLHSSSSCPLLGVHSFFHFFSRFPLTSLPLTPTYLPVAYLCSFHRSSPHDPHCHELVPTFMDCCIYGPH
jgi:hypothetical protein